VFYILISNEYFIKNNKHPYFARFGRLIPIYYIFAKRNKLRERVGERAWNFEKR